MPEIILLKNEAEQYGNGEPAVRCHTFLAFLDTFYQQTTLQLCSKRIGGILQTIIIKLIAYKLDHTFRFLTNHCKARIVGSRFR